MRRYNAKLVIALVVLAVPFVYGLAQYTADQSTAFLPSIVKSAQTTDMFDGYLSDCDTIHWGIRIGVVVSGYNGVWLDLGTLPGGPYAIVYSDAPDGTVLGQSDLAWVTFAASEQTIADDWYVWMVNSSNQRASDIVSAQSTGELGMGNCQLIQVRFFSPSIAGVTHTAIPPHPATETPSPTTATPSAIPP